MVSLMDHAKRVAEQIIAAQESSRHQQPSQPAQPIIITTGSPPAPPIQPVTQPSMFKEVPKPLSYYYSPHKYETVKAGETKTIYDFTVPPDHIFHIEIIANNWFEDTYSMFEIDGAVIEKVERFIGNINSPLSIKGRYMTARHSVRWVAVNKSSNDQICECLIDGTVYLETDFKQLIGKFL